MGFLKRRHALLEEGHKIKILQTFKLCFSKVSLPRSASEKLL